MPSGYIQVWGGPFISSNGRPYAAGSLYARPSNETVAAGAGQISYQEVLLGVLDNQGNLPLSANARLWANDTLTPSGTVYALRVTDTNGAPVYGPVNYYISGNSPVNLGVFVPTSVNVSYPAPIVQNPVGDQTIQTNNLLPAAGNTTQSLGNSAAPWNATLNNLTVQGTTQYAVVNATTGFQVNGAAPAGNVLRGNGADFVSAQLAAADLSNGTSGSGLVLLQTSPSITQPTIFGIVPNYNSMATAANGLSAIVGAVDLTTQAATISATTIIAAPASGNYKLDYYAKVTRAATSSSSLQVQAIFTDGDSTTPTLSAAAQTGNTTTSVCQGSFILSCLVNTNIQYAVQYASTGGTTMQYNLHLRLSYQG